MPILSPIRLLEMDATSDMHPLANLDHNVKVDVGVQI